MALYSFANGQIIPALRLLYRARYLAVLIYGDDHPDMAQLDVSFRNYCTCFFSLQLMKLFKMNFRAILRYSCMRPVNSDIPFVFLSMH